MNSLIQMKKNIFIILLAIAVVGGGFYLYKRQGLNSSEKSIQLAVTKILAQKYNRPAKTLAVEVDLNMGTFARGSVNFTDQPGGGMWFAAKTAKGWELAFDGNGLVPCEAAEKYAFPKVLVPQCIDSQNGNNLIER